MQLELFADATQVKKKYRELALVYHPDKNPKNKHSEEYFKIITQGYNILNEPSKKLIYDDLLRNYYQKKEMTRDNPLKKQSVREKIKRHRERKRQEIIKEYVKTENEFPHKYRLIIAVGIFLSGILMCYNRWFINYLKFDIIYVISGFIIFGLGCYLIANNVYRREAFKHALNLKDGSVSARAVRVFAVLFFLTPILFSGLVYATEKIHLQYFYDVTVVKKVSFFNDEVRYDYEVNNEEISRTTEAIRGTNYADYSKMRVKFSRINPNISELVLLK
jgi:hypothetical protein